MKPANGAYRLTTLAQPGHPSTTVTYTVTDAGIPTTFGLLVWNDGPPGRFERGEIAIYFNTLADFVAVNGPLSFAGTYSPA